MTRPGIHPGPPGRVLLLEPLEDRTLLNASLPAPVGSINPSSYDPTHILVRFISGDAASAGPLPGAASERKLDLVSGLYEIQLNPGFSVADAVTVYGADPRVASVEPDFFLATAGVPNDPSFNQQWGLQNTGQSGGVAGVDVHAPAAWGVTTGSGKVVTALIDTGLNYNHPDLYQNVWINQAEIPLSRLAHLVDVYHDGYISFRDLNNPINQGVGKITDVNGDGRIDAADILAPMVLDAQGKDTGRGGWSYAGNTRDGDTAHPNDFFGWNFVANNNNPFDDNGHGTNVAGILGATGNNGLGVAGVAWTTSLMPLKAFDSTGHARIGDIIAAIGYSIKHGAKISNNSWSGASPSPDLFAALASSQNAGQLFVDAAGNQALNNDQNPDFPSYYGTKLDNIVTVAALDRTGKLAAFSNYGPTTVTLGAPGVDIFSTALNGGYSSYTGTSQAVPFVSGAAALIWSIHPTWTYKQVIAQIEKTVTPLASLKGKTLTGGMVNLAAAVGAGQGTNPPPQGSPTPAVTDIQFSGASANSLNQIVVTFSQPIDGSSLSPAAIRLTDPNGRVVPITTARLVAGSNGRQVQILFATQTTYGRYLVTLPAGIRSQAGVHMALYEAGYTLAPTYTYSSAKSVAIPDLGSAFSTITVDPSILITNVQVVLNITHPRDGDLYIHLQGPNGTDVTLAYRVGGAGQNFTNTVFDDQASLSIRSGQAPFTGAFQPFAQLSNFKGLNAHGVWKLWVEDRAGGAVGVLNSWSLILNQNVTTSGEPSPAPSHGREIHSSGDADAKTASAAEDVHGGPLASPLGTAGLSANDLFGSSIASLTTGDPPSFGGGHPPAPTYGAARVDDVFLSADALARMHTAFLLDARKDRSPTPDGVE